MTLGGAGADGLAPNIGVAFPITDDGSLPARKDLDQPTAESQLKDAMKESQGWNSATNIAFAGLDRTGIPLVLNIIQSLIKRLFDLATNFPGVKQALNAVENFPLFGIVKQITKMLTGGGGDDPDPVVLSTVIPVTLVSAQGAGNPVTMFLRNALAFFNISNWLDGSFNPLTKAIEFIEGILKPTGLLAWLDIDGLIPDFQAPAIVADIIHSIESAVVDVPTTIGNLIGSVFDSVRSLLGIGNDAQGSANNANSSVAAILAKLNGDAVTGGVTIAENFDEANSTSLSSAIWNQTGVGSGSGQDGPNGDGQLEWRESGTSPRGFRERHKTPLATIYQSVACVVSSKFTRYSNVQAKIRLLARMDAAETEWIEALIACSSSNDQILNLSIGYTLAGTYVGDFATGSVKNLAGSTYELQVGMAASDYQYKLLVNDVTILNYTDGSHASPANPATNLYTGMMRTSGTTVFFGPLFSKKPPNVEVFAAADRTP